jgi:hypothetical protein
MRISRIALAAAVVLAACGGDKATGPKPGDQTTTELTCAGSGGKTNCTIPIAGKTNFTIVVESIGCEAQGNVLRIVAPTAETLSDNACSLTPGKTWNFTAPTGTFSSGAALNLNVTAKYFADPPTLQLSTVEEGKKWRVVFEDGYDKDYNDVILLVTAS